MTTVAPFVNAKRYMGLAIEGTRGSAETLTSEDFNISFYNIEVDPQIEATIRDVSTGRHTRASALMGRQKVVIKARHDLAPKLMPSDLSIPMADKIMQVLGCPYNTDLTSAAGVFYTPDPDADVGATGTIWVMYPSFDSSPPMMIAAKGVKADAQIVGKVGGPLVLDVTFTGVLTEMGPYEGGSVPVYTPDNGDNGSLKPPVIINASTQMAGEDRNIAEFTLSLGNIVELYDDASDPSGYSFAYITQRVPKLSVKFMVAVDDEGNDLTLTNWQAGQEMIVSISTGTVENDNGSASFSLNIPKAQVLGYRLEDRGGSLSGSVDMELHEQYGGDEWQLIENTP